MTVRRKKLIWDTYSSDQIRNYVIKRDKLTVKKMKPLKEKSNIVKNKLKWFHNHWKHNRMAARLEWKRRAYIGWISERRWEKVLWLEVVQCFADIKAWEIDDVPRNGTIVHWEGIWRKKNRLVEFREIRWKRSFNCHLCRRRVN